MKKLIVLISLLCILSSVFAQNGFGFESVFHKSGEPIIVTHRLDNQELFGFTPEYYLHIQLDEDDIKSKESLAWADFKNAQDLIDDIVRFPDAFTTFSLSNFDSNYSMIPLMINDKKMIIGYAHDVDLWFITDGDHIAKQQRVVRWSCEFTYKNDFAHWVAWCDDMHDDLELKYIRKVSNLLKDYLHTAGTVVATVSRYHNSDPTHSSGHPCEDFIEKEAHKVDEILLHTCTVDSVSDINWVYFSKYNNGPMSGPTAEKILSYEIALALGVLSDLCTDGICNKRPVLNETGHSKLDHTYLFVDSDYKLTWKNLRNIKSDEKSKSWLERKLGW